MHQRSFTWWNTTHICNWTCQTKRVTYFSTWIQLEDFIAVTNHNLSIFLQETSQIKRFYNEKKRVGILYRILPRIVCGLVPFEEKRMPFMWKEDQINISEKSHQKSDLWRTFGTWHMSTKTGSKWISQQIPQSDDESLSSSLRRRIVGQRSNKNGRSCQVWKEDPCEVPLDERPTPVDPQQCPVDVQSWKKLS